MKDPRDRFTGIAPGYGKHRPEYPRALAEWIARTAGIRPPARVADVGCGTGISTRLFVALGYRVVGIDPNRDMLAAARAAGGGSWVRAEASATGLATGSVDLVISGQSMHWFDLDLAIPEFRRIVRPGGWAAAFWNLRASSPLLDDYEALLVRSSREYRALDKGADAIRGIEARVPGLIRAEFPNRQVLDREGFLGRVRSSSYVVHGIDRPEEFDRALDALFDRHRAGGVVEFLYRTVAVAWPFPSARFTPSRGLTEPEGESAKGDP